MNKLETIAHNVRSCFDKLWSLKIRGGNTIEIITPYSTTTSKFVSLFVTERNGKFIVSDGGLLSSEAYESEIDYENQCLLKILYHFESFYQIKKTQDKQGNKHYYKTTSKEVLIPNLVYEMAQFISMCASSATVQFEDPKEVDERVTFRKKASSYLHANFQKESIRFRGNLDKEDFRTVRFSAIIERRSRLSLVSYLTGSNPANLISSIAKANMNFEIASSSKYNQVIDNKVVLINNTAEGYIPSKISKQLTILEEHIGQKAVNWTERDRLLSILN